MYISAAFQLIFCVNSKVLPHRPIKKSISFQNIYIRLKYLLVWCDEFLYYVQINSACLYVTLLYALYIGIAVVSLIKSNMFKVCNLKNKGVI